MEPQALQAAGRGVIPLGLGFGTQEIGKSLTCDPPEASVLSKLTFFPSQHCRICVPEPWE